MGILHRPHIPLAQQLCHKRGAARQRANLYLLVRGVQTQAARPDAVQRWDAHRRREVTIARAAAAILGQIQPQPARDRLRLPRR